MTSTDKIGDSDLVIPFCARVLKFEENKAAAYNNTINASDPFGELSQEKELLPNYAQSDGAVQPGLYQYSRSVHDLSTYILLYPSLHTPPLLAATSIIEDEAHCARNPTPAPLKTRDCKSPESEMAETFTLNCDHNNAGVHLALARNMANKARARFLVAGTINGSNGDVVGSLIKAWKEDEVGTHAKDLVFNGDKVRWFWQEIKNMMESPAEMVPSWPEA